MKKEWGSIENTLLPLYEHSHPIILHPNLKILILEDGFGYIIVPNNCALENIFGIHKGGNKKLVTEIIREGVVPY